MNSNLIAYEKQFEYLKNDFIYLTYDVLTDEKNKLLILFDMYINSLEPDCFYEKKIDEINLLCDQHFQEINPLDANLMRIKVLFNINRFDAKIRLNLVNLLYDIDARLFKIENNISEEDYTFYSKFVKNYDATIPDCIARNKVLPVEEKFTQKIKQK